MLMKPALRGHLELWGLGHAEGGDFSWSKRQQDHYTPLIRESSSNAYSFTVELPGELFTNADAIWTPLYTNWTRISGHRVQGIGAFWKLPKWSQWATEWGTVVYFMSNMLKGPQEDILVVGLEFSFWRFSNLTGCMGCADTWAWQVWINEWRVLETGKWILSICLGSSGEQ